MADLTTILDSLQAAITSLQEQVPKSNAKLSTAYTAVLGAVGALAGYLKLQQGGGGGGVADVQVNKDLRRLEDELDDSRQQSLKGNFVITSKATGDKECLIKNDDQLSGGETLLSHVISLVQSKLGVDLPEGDVSSCQRLQNGSVVLRVWNRKLGSAYEKMVDAIKSGKNNDINVFFNFQLTRRRNNILYEVRQLKKTKKIAKYYSDENGNIKILKKLGDKKIKITSITSKDSPDLKTYTVQEVKAMG